MLRQPPTMKSLSTVLLLLLPGSAAFAPLGHSFRLVNDNNVRRLGLDGAAPVGMAIVPPGRSSSPSSARTTTATATTKGKSAATSDDRYPPSDDDVSGRLPRRTAAAFERRPFLRDVAAALSILPPSSAALLVSEPSRAAEAAVDRPLPPPRVTHKVRMDVRISRADGSFYVRDAPPPAAASASVDDDDDPFYGTLVLGLFGDVAPNHVMRFLGYVDVPYDVDAPLPSYSRSKFDTLDASTGLLIGGTVSSVLSRIRDDAKNYNRGQDIILFSSLSSLRASFISFTHRLSSPYRALRKIGGG